MDGDSTRTGWFIGFIEQSENTCFFAAHIEGSNHASGSTARSIVQKILADQEIY